jgi:hypothetical protein
VRAIAVALLDSLAAYGYYGFGAVHDSCGVCHCIEPSRISARRNPRSGSPGVMIPPRYWDDFRESELGSLVRQRSE